MAVLLQYNTSTSWSVAQLQENTQITLELLIQILNILVKTRVLIIGDDESSEISENTTICLSPDYKK